jgi:hypothetical protein
METPLAKFKKYHLSPSAINAFRADPVAQVKRMFQGFKDADNMNMVRGRVAEQVVEMLILKKIKLDDVTKTCEKVFADETSLTPFTSDEKEKTLENLLGKDKAKGMILNMYEAYKEIDPKEPYQFQTNHETILKGTLTKLKGKTDMEDPKVVIDWKATAQIRKIEIDNKVQGGIYHKMTGGKRVIFIKASKTRFEIQELTSKEIYEGMETAVHVINAIENICKKFDNLEDYFKIMYAFKKYDRSNIMEDEIKNEYRKLFNTKAYNGI